MALKLLLWLLLLLLLLPQLHLMLYPKRTNTREMMGFASNRGGHRWVRRADVRPHRVSLVLQKVQEDKDSGIACRESNGKKTH